MSGPSARPQLKIPTQYQQLYSLTQLLRNRAGGWGDGYGGLAIRTRANTRWSRNNRYLLTSSSDATLIIWDLLPLQNSPITPITPISRDQTSIIGGSRKKTIRLSAPITDAQFHPANSNLILITLSVNEVLLLDLRDGGGRYVIEDSGEDVKVDNEVEKDVEDEEVEEARPEKKRWVVLRTKSIPTSCLLA